LATAPKKEFYYLLEHQLVKRGIVLSNETVHENPIGLTITHAVLYIKGLRVAVIDSASLWTVFFYSQGSISSLKLDASLANMLPGALAHARASYSIVDPSHIYVRIDDPQIQASGTVDLDASIVHIVFTKQPPKTLMQYLKQTKEGWIYEKHF
jgi:hypothetical protein